LPEKDPRNKLYVGLPTADVKGQSSDGKTLPSKIIVTAKVYRYDLTSAASIQTINDAKAANIAGFSTIISFTGS
jgi:hypothetical protein